MFLAPLLPAGAKKLESQKNKKKPLIYHCEQPTPVNVQRACLGAYCFAPETRAVRECQYT